MEETKELLRLCLLNAIAGKLSHTGDDSVFLLRKAYPLYGDAQLPLYPKKLAEIMLKWAGLCTQKERQKEDILVLDLETTGLGRVGNIAIIIGMGYYEGEDFIVEQVFLPDLDAEEHSLDYFLERLKKHSLIISFNGKSFDLPILQSRYLYYQSWLDFDDYEHLDLLHLARRLWKRRLPSCALETLEYYILGQEREAALEIDGRDIPQSYYHYLMHGDAEIIRKILLHNQHDILYTAALFCLISDSVAYPPVQRDIRIDYHALALLYQSQNDLEIAKRILLDLYEDEEITPDMLYSLGMLHKKAGESEEALGCFAAATQLLHPLACLEYAKALEKRRDYAGALEAAESLYRYEKGRALQNYRAIADLEKRLTRLKRKLDKNL